MQQHRFAALLLALFFVYLSLSGDEEDEEEEVLQPNMLPTLSGYLPVVKAAGVVQDEAAARMFYAYYEAIEPQQNAAAPPPIVVWLQGGPGCSSMIGNFYELGPWRVGSEDVKLHRNPAPWNRRFGLLFLDNPVGSGYSLAPRDQDIPVNQQQVVQHLSTALDAFFRLYPSFRNRPLFLAGESYAGKYVPALGHYMASKLLNNDTGTAGREFPFRLDGIIVGNGLTDPELQVSTHAQTAYSFGLIDRQQKAHVDLLAKRVVRLVQQQEWQAAYRARTDLVDWIANVSGLATVLDVRRTVPYHCMDNGTEFLGLFLNKQFVKAALKADESAVWQSCSPRVRKFMSNDTMKSVKWMVDDLLDAQVPVLLYQGLFDLKDGVASSEEWMETLKWEFVDSFFSSERSIWRVGGGAVAGYWRSFGPLTHVVVSAAGHQVPADQELHSQQMVETWIQQAIAEKTSEMCTSLFNKTTLLIAT